MKLKLIIGLLIVFSFGCNNKPKEKTDFAEIINDRRVNSKEVGEREGIKYFQIMKNGKMGFRDLNGNVVIEPKFDYAEMFSEGFSNVQNGNKWGLIDTTGKYILQTQYEYLGPVHNGLASFRTNDKYGFIDIKGQEKIKPQFDWTDHFSEGLCVVRNDNGKPGSGKSGYIDTTGKLVINFQFQYACKFEKGQAKVELNNLWGSIDKNGKVVVEPTHKNATDW